ncbi:MAG TPA: hypothetical protein VNQ90_21260 [Chthoniobacteraceae bacterium]|nr:hypothetical protein [Chthoniobacteraceae bacterium]
MMIFRLFLLIASPIVLFASAPGDRWVWENGPARVAIDSGRTGQMVQWSVGARKVVDAASPVSPLRVEDDRGRIWSFFATHSRKEEQRVEVFGYLGLSPEGGRQIPARVSYTVEGAGETVVVEVDVQPDKQSLPRETLWQLDLALAPRKRIFYLSDHGLKWETRYFYQLTYEPRAGGGNPHPTLLPEADRNEWRFFSLDQLGPDAYRLWKSESETTAPLIMHEGRHPAPIVQLYDERGGLTLEYPQLRQSTPSALRVDAGGKGSLQVAFQPGSPQKFILNAADSEAAILEERAGLVSHFQKEATPHPRLEDILREPEWLRKTPEQKQAPAYVTGGYPFSKGTLRNTGDLRVEVGGEAVAFQARPLAWWPDGSLKWVLLVLAIDPAKAMKEAPAPRVSLRRGGFLPVGIHAAKSVPPEPSSTLKVTATGGGEVEVRNGDLRVTLGPGTDWLRRLRWRKEELVNARNRASAYCDYRLDPRRVLPFKAGPEGGSDERGILEVESVTVEESGPLRGVVRLEGLTTNREPTRIILRLEFLAGRPEIRITHSAVFRFEDPRKNFLTGMGLEIPLPAALARKQVKLIQPSVEHRQLQVNGKTIDPGANDLHGWLRLEAGEHRVSAAIRNFRQLAPKALVVEQGRLRFELWPGEVAPMDVRRYSNHLHPAQLESPVTAPLKKDWINQEYYASSPFYGISRTHEMLLAFGSDEAGSVAADFQSPPLLYAGWAHYQATGTVLPASAPGGWPRAWSAWTRLTRFFLFHRELHRWYGFWNFGDFRHRFRRGYGWSHPPEILAGLLKGEIKDDPLALQKKRRRDYFPPNDWNYDNGAYGWTNTEGLPGLFLQHEYLRHGNRTVYFAAEAMARHSRDVVTRQEGRWLGGGTRHGVQPWSDGNHDERQTSITEYRLHYFLSGDARSRDVIGYLYRNAYTRGNVKPASFHSARLGGLLFHWELTGDAKEAAQLRRYIGLFLSDEGFYAQPDVSFPGPVQAGPPGQLNQGRMFFNTFGGMHALLEYQQMTGDVEIRQALIRMADVLIRNPMGSGPTLNNGDYFWPAVAFAALHAPDPGPYQDYLRRYLTDAGGWRSAYQPVSRDPSGPNAFMLQAVPHTFFWANWAPYVTLALGEREIWTPKMAAQFAGREKGPPAPKPSHELYWQSDYDGVPELESYLGPQQPWKSPRLPSSHSPIP